jgi:hypothetical protein
MTNRITDIFYALNLSGAHLIWGVIIVLLTSACGFAAMGFLVVRMPAGYFCERTQGDFVSGKRAGVHRWIGRAAKNVCGVVIILLGAVAALPGIPGPGLLIVLGGLMLTDFPGKRRFEIWLVKRPGILATINRLRQSFGKPPIFFEETPETKCLTNAGDDRQAGIGS